jgi:hypothetical protein
MGKHGQVARGAAGVGGEKALAVPIKPERTAWAAIGEESESGGFQEKIYDTS